MSQGPTARQQMERRKAAIERLRQATDFWVSDAASIAMEGSVRLESQGGRHRWVIALPFAPEERGPAGGPAPTPAEAKLDAWAWLDRQLVGLHAKLKEAANPQR
jgi:hypothetical protein